jgi:hypothetical protein
MECNHLNLNLVYQQTRKQTPWFQSASELYRPSDSSLSAKLVPTLADRGCRSAQRIPTAVNFGFLDRSRYFLKIAPQLLSRG